MNETTILRYLYEKTGPETKPASCLAAEQPTAAPESSTAWPVGYWPFSTASDTSILSRPTATTPVFGGFSQELLDQSWHGAISFLRAAGVDTEQLMAAAEANLRQLHLYAAEEPVDDE